MRRETEMCATGRLATWAHPTHSYVTHPAARPHHDHVGVAVEKRKINVFTYSYTLGHEFPHQRCRVLHHCLALS